MISSALTLHFLPSPLDSPSVQIGEFKNIDLLALEYFAHGGNFIFFPNKIFKDRERSAIEYFIFDHIYLIK